MPPKRTHDRLRTSRFVDVRLTAILGAMLAIGGLSGCRTGPRTFAAVIDPSALNRARAVSLGEGQPDTVAIPALIARLDDDDPVVRLSANDGLKRRTGQDFGFVPWADPAERMEAVARWRGWWNDRLATLPKGDPKVVRTAGVPGRG